MMSQTEGLSHGGSAAGQGLEPDWEFDLLLDNLTVVSRNLFDTFLDSRRGVGDLAQRNQISSSERAAKSRADLGAVANDTDFVKISHSFAAGALDDQVVEQPVYSVGDAVAFPFAVTTGDGFNHRA